MFVAWSLMSAARLVGADRFVRYVADAAFNAVVDADLADRAERFVVKSRDTQCGPQFLVELSQIFQMRGQGWQFQAIIGQQKLLVAGVPKARKAALQHDRRHNRHLVKVVRTFAKFRAAAVFFHAHDAARAADGKAKRRQAFDLLWCELLFDIPHGPHSLVKAESSVKRTAVNNFREAGSW
jgi:hypothetical protein